MHILVIYRQCGFWIIPINTGNNNVWIFTPIALRWGSSKFIFRVNDLLKSPYSIPYNFGKKKVVFWGKIQLISQYHQMKLRTHHLTQTSWKTHFRCQWKNPLQFQIQTQIPIQFHILNLRCWRLRCDFEPGIHLPYWPLYGLLQQYVIFGRIFGSFRDLTNTH